jgi:LysM repeat protein
MHTEVAPSSLGSAPEDEGYLMRAAVPKTTIPKRPRRDIITYIVESGDNVSIIAEKFEISPETIVWANGELADDPDMLYVGQQLLILPVSGVYHTVKKGDTLESIAKAYKVDVAAITGYQFNQLREPYQLTEGQNLIVPGGQKPPPPPKVVRIYSGPIPADAAKGTGHFGWPASGPITQKYWSHHRAVDIGAAQGSTVVAADSGFVVYAGWNNQGYGNLVVIDHRNGYQTLYAHLDSVLIQVGQSIAKGQKIGLVGATGRTRSLYGPGPGVHLHFEIRLNGVQVNPFTYLH